MKKRGVIEYRRELKPSTVGQASTSVYPGKHRHPVCSIVILIENSEPSEEGEPG